MKHLHAAVVLALALALLTAFGAPAQAAPRVRLVTTLGAIVVQLDEERAPITTANFLQYVRSGFYNGTIFHRVIPNFMIQGGGMTADMREKPGMAPIKNESGNGLRNRRYSIAMARTSRPDSATSQFFINVKENRFLDKDRAQDGVGYAVFGQVVEGQGVVDKIVRVRTKTVMPHQDVPVTPVVITSATVIREK